MLNLNYTVENIYGKKDGCDSYSESIIQRDKFKMKHKLTSKLKKYFDLGHNLGEI